MAEYQDIIYEVERGDCDDHHQPAGEDERVPAADLQRIDQLHS